MLFAVDVSHILTLEQAVTIEECRGLCDQATQITSVGIDHLLAKNWSKVWQLLMIAREKRDEFELFSPPYRLCVEAIRDAEEKTEVIRIAL